MFCQINLPSRSAFCSLLTLLIAIWGATAIAQLPNDQAIKIVLAGDSTVTDESGWGKGFSELMKDRGTCINLAKSGRSSRSYRQEGWWAKCLEEKPSYILIQFGHNDQPGKGPERESAAATDFRDHLRAYVKEARELGIKPILVTSLTRRKWSVDGKIEPTLAEYADATLAVAEELAVPVIDLHRLSIGQCENIGPTAYRVYEPMTEKGADHTHLNTEGSRVVASLVVGQLTQLVRELNDLVDHDKLSRYSVAGVRPLKRESGKLSMAESDATIEIRYGSKPFLTYNIISPQVPDGLDPAYHRSGFIHPIATPAGAVVTAAFPADHPHQHGIFSAWVSTQWRERELDFWNLAKGTGRVLHQRVVNTFAESKKIGFEVDLIHRAEQQPVVDILRERWKIVAHETDGRFYMFDLHATQTNLTDFPLTIHDYHYGGMGYRGPVRWLSDSESKKSTDGATEVRSDPFQFINDAGEDRIQGNSNHSKWIVAQGRIESQPVSITVLCHRNNFRAPQAARLHPTKPYFAFSPCIDGQFTIDQQHEYQAAYRYLITDNEPNPNWIQEQWDQWHKD